MARHDREAELLKTLPGFGDVIVAGGGRDRPGPAPALRHRQPARLLGDPVPGQLHEREEEQGRADRRRRRLYQAAAHPGRLGRGPGTRRLQARFRRLVRKFGGPRSKGAQKRAITAIAHTLLKIAYGVLKTGTPYADLGADFYTRRESPDARQDYLMRRLQKLNPGCVITITPAETA